MKEKILKIQNGAKSLMWGCTRHSETETLFAVGHKSYPTEVLYIMVSDDYVVSLIDTYEHKEVFKKCCESEKQVLEVIIETLKRYFPAKGVDIQ